MRTLRMELRWAMIALTVLACLAPVARLGAEERDSTLRRRALKLNDITGKDPIAGEMKSLLADKDGARKLLAEAARMTKEKPQPFNYNATQILASLAWQLKDYNSAEIFYRLNLDQAKQLLSTKRLVSAYSGLIDALDRNKKYAEAEKLCQEALALESDPADGDEERKSVDRFRSSVMEEMIFTIARQGDVDRALELIDRVLKGKPDSWLVAEFKAKVFVIADKPADAAKSYQDELERLKKDKDLTKEDREEQIDNVHYHLSGLYVDLNQIDKAAEQLKKLLDKHPDNPTYNNDLGYIWADHDMNLTESEKLIRKAIEEERKLREKLKAKIKENKRKVAGDDEAKIEAELGKDNPAYLDSLGWVLYKQKKYKEAKKYLQEAVAQEEGKHVEILDHLGEVHMALGEKAEAVAAWKKGIEVAGDTKREKKRKAEVAKKIEANK